MELLYSNILPLALEDGQASIIDSFHEQIALSDRVEIAVSHHIKVSPEQSTRQTGVLSAKQFTAFSGQVIHP